MISKYGGEHEERMPHGRSGAILEPGDFENPVRAVGPWQDFRFYQRPSGATIANAKVTVQTRAASNARPPRTIPATTSLQTCRPALYDGRRGRWFPEIRDYEQQT